ncbi:hypothetical protein D9M69_439480 [compost metagenome]
MAARFGQLADNGADSFIGSCFGGQEQPVAGRHVFGVLVNVGIGQVEIAEFRTAQGEAIRLDVGIVTAQEEVHIMARSRHLQAIEAANGTCADDANANSTLFVHGVSLL